MQARFEILSDLFNKEYTHMMFHSKTAKTKKGKELHLALSSIKPEIRDWVLWRYLRFTRD